MASIMEQNESVERFREGLLRAASCCRELSKITRAQEWHDLSTQLMVMLNKGLKFYKGAALTEPQVMQLVSEMEMAQKLARQMSTGH